MSESMYSGDSLCSCGSNGTGERIAAVHDALLDPLNGTKYDNSFNELLHFLAREESPSVEKGPAYLALIEWDGEPDHNLAFISNHLALSMLF